MEKHWIDRKKFGMPIEQCFIEIQYGVDEIECRWEPPNNKRLISYSDGYLGSAMVISGNYKNVGFNAWEQNDSEFRYYRLI